MVRGYGLGPPSRRRIAVVGDAEEGSRVMELVRMMEPKCEFAGVVVLGDDAPQTEYCIGKLSQIRELLPLYRLNEVIFCAKDIPTHDIVDWMQQLRAFKVEYRIAPENANTVIGSNSIFSADAPYVAASNAITQPAHRRAKRAFDICSALLLLLFLPIDVWFVSNRCGFVGNIFAVLAGRKSWVGCRLPGNVKTAQLRPGVLFPTDALPVPDVSDEIVAIADELYMRDYSVHLDMRTMAKGRKRLGRK